MSPLTLLGTNVLAVILLTTISGEPKQYGETGAVFIHRSHL